MRSRVAVTALAVVALLAPAAAAHADVVRTSTVAASEAIVYPVVSATLRRTQQDREVRRMRMRIIATLAAVLAMLVPAGVAHADPGNPIFSVTLNVPEVSDSPSGLAYPVTDGVGDWVTISGAVDAATDRRVRGSVTVTVGTRVLRTWILSSTGPFSFDWDGKAGSTVVPGNAVVRLRVIDDDGTPYTATRPLVISAKKVTALTYTKVVTPLETFDCYDNVVLDMLDPNYLAHQSKICPITWFGPGAGQLILKGTKSSGPATYVGYLNLPSAVNNTLRDPVVRVTAAFTQRGAGANAFWACVEYSCPPIGVKSFSGSATLSASARLDGFTSGPPGVVNWSVRAAHGHDLIVKSWTVRVTYYALR